jgi:REP element-mobilizing transposase RayT
LDGGGPPFHAIANLGGRSFAFFAKGGSPEQPHVWQRRFYDFNVWSERKRVEKLRYMHRNPVKDGLATEPEHWEWSSYRSYAYQEEDRKSVV